MAEFTLKQLRYFEAVSRHLHFGMAADACAISQPALSMQIKELETAIGAALFERSARQVRLTTFGEQFGQRAREILRAADDLSDLARANGDRLNGRIRLGVIPTIAPYLLPTLIKNMRTDNGELDLQVRETLTPRLVQELSDGRLDLAIVALPLGEKAFEEVPLFSEEFVLIRPLSDAGNPVPKADALSDMRLLLLEEGHCLRDQTLAYCSMRTAQAVGGLDGSSLSTLVQMVGAGMGVTLLPEMAIGVETRAAAVDVARFAGRGPTRTIGLIWRKTNPLAAQFATIAEIVRQSAIEVQQAK